METSNNLASKVATSTKWSALTQIMAKLISPLVNIVLARVLTPEAFGIVASLTIVTSFADVFTDAGFQKYLIQHRFKDEGEFQKNVDVAFWTNLTLSAIIVLVIVFFRDQLAALVGCAGEGIGIAVASAVILISAFSSVQTAVCQRNLDFKSLFKARLISVFIPLLVTVPLALIFKNYWALIIGNLCVQAINAIMMTILSSWKPHFFYSFKLLKEMFSFTMWTLVESISIWLTAYVGTFIVGRILSSYYLGLYKTSISTVNGYMTLITNATTPVLFSALSKKQDAKDEYMNIFYSFQSYVGMLVLPLGIGIFVFRDFVVSILLGSQWVEAELFLGLWGMTSGFATVTSSYCSEIYRSLGKPKESLLAQCLFLIVLIPTIYFSAQTGYDSLIIWRPIITFAMLPIHLVLLKLFCKINSFGIIKNIIPQLLAAIIMGIVGVFVRTIFPGLIWTIASIIICVIVYFGILFCVPKQRELLLNTSIVKKVLKKRKE